MAPTPKSTKSEKPKSDGKNPKPSNEIDDIFQSKKPKEKPTKEVEKSGPEKKLKAEGGIKKKKEKKKKSGSGRVLEEGSKSRARRRKTADGFTIYSAEELGFGKSSAGGTALCPFDCDCCF